jgi:hypothetical protein
MAATVLMPLKARVINANGICRQGYEFRTQLQDLHTNVALRETSSNLREALYSKLSFFGPTASKKVKAELLLQLEKEFHLTI